MSFYLWTHKFPRTTENMILALLPMKNGIIPAIKTSLQYRKIFALYEFVADLTTWDNLNVFPYIKVFYSETNWEENEGF